MSVAGYRHAKLMLDAKIAGVTVEDLARARASFADKETLAAFDAEQARGELTSGTFVAHVVWIERLLIRATNFANERRNANKVIGHV